MNHQIKKNIRILSERFGHQIEYDKDDVKLKNSINEITLSSRDKYGTVVNYNSHDGINQVKVIDTDLYGILIQLMRRQTLNQKIRFHYYFDPSEFLVSEGQQVSEVMKEIRRKVDNEEIDILTYGGNMYEIEYFKGLVLIMGITDGFGYTVIELKKNK